MLSSTMSLGMHLIWTSYQGVQAVGQVLGYYNTMTAPKVDLNRKHLRKGDALPPHTGKPRVYSMRFCPYAQRTVLALDAKQVDYEVVNIDLVDKPEWFESKSPLGAKVPALEMKEGELLIESGVTVEYIDDIYPQRPLVPKDPSKKAHDKIIIEVVANYIHPVFFKLVKDHTNITQEQIDAFYKGLQYIQDALKSRGTTFLDGEEPGFGDYMIWPWFERVFVYDDDRVQIEDPKYELLRSYIKKMEEDPVVKLSMVQKDIMKKFLLTYRTGNKPDYEILHK